MPQPIDVDALAALLAEHGPALALVAAQWTASPDDCVQEALVELAALPAAPERPAAWLFTRVRQRALNAARSTSRRREREQAAWRDRLTPVSGDPVDAAEALDLVEALAGLSPEDRELVTLRFYSGLSYAEVAEVLGVSRSAAHRRTESALETLRRRLESPCTARTNN